ncbi:hypothetical protein [Fluviispira multicolorata]|uniref:Cytochrome c domain-containing protein n=1 Tax=Fluviispira multicolorata TaxID=2654512 RepID=A0A833N551_9BACT|nr:hypothetical protein [Fluviispira multicolorata]KAB8033472.1 hypothetical protein GCL57_01860 [Fluviispira multicolorata]
MRFFYLFIIFFISLAYFSIAASQKSAFLNNNGKLPTAEQYQGPLFNLNHDYPSTPIQSKKNMPWHLSIKNKLINKTNASIYVEALKNYIAKDMKNLLFNYKKWSSHKQNWYNEPWVFSLREPIHGMYVGNENIQKNLFEGTQLNKNFSTYVLTYFDKISAYTLYKIWKKDAQKPFIEKQNTQFSENSIIVKLAFTTADENSWPVMKNALAWPLYISVNATEGLGSNAAPKLTKTYFMQLDIIVKDSKSSPKTNWIFTTLVYDYMAKGNNIWDKMIPLGAQWGNDPEIDSTRYPNAVLNETWLNPNAPKYSKMTLGWGGRLAGPNDGAVNNITFKENGKNIFKKNAQNSSCMSCHGASQWNPKKPEIGLESSIFPSPTNALTMKENNKINYIESLSPASQNWKKWFQNKRGFEAQNTESIAFDYNMVIPFLSLPAFYTVKTGKKHRLYNDSFEVSPP